MWFICVTDARQESPFQILHYRMRCELWCRMNTIKSKNIVQRKVFFSLFFVGVWFYIFSVICSKKTSFLMRLDGIQNLPISKLRRPRAESTVLF